MLITDLILVEVIPFLTTLNENNLKLFVVNFGGSFGEK